MVVQGPLVPRATNGKGCSYEGPGDSCASAGSPPSARHTMTAALAASSLRMEVPSYSSASDCVAKTVGAARVRAMTQRLLLARYDVSGAAVVQRWEAVMGGSVRRAV